MSWIGWLGYSAVAVVVVGWLVVSFSAPTPRRVVVEWLAACGLYVALLMLFTNLLMRAHAAGNTFALVAFGFLMAMFGTGLVLALVHTLRAARGTGKAQTSATN